MTSQQRQRLEQSLRQHGEHLMQVLNREDRYQSGIHGLVAVQLRVLLCDAQCPILLTYADEKMANIYLYGPVQYPARLRQAMVVHVNSQIIGRNPFVGSQAYDLRTYLDSTIQVVPVRGFRDECPGDDVTPRKLIKWVANKDGFAHFDFDPPQAFEALKTWHRIDALGVTNEFVIKENLFQLAGWTIEIIDRLLAAGPSENLS